MIENAQFVAVTRRFIGGNTDKIQALFGILDSPRYGIGRKISAIADVLGMARENVPTMGNRHLGVHAKMTEREIRQHLVVALRPDWRGHTREASEVRVRRSQLREREALDWLRLPLSERLRLKRASRAANGMIGTVPPAPKTVWVWQKLNLAKYRLLALG